MNFSEDLEFVYLYLYGNKGNTVHKNKYNELFEMFKNQVRNDGNGVEFPPRPSNWS